MSQGTALALSRRDHVERPLTSIVTTQPFEHVSIDLLHLDKCKSGYGYIFVIVDHFTRFAQAYQNLPVADKIFNDYALKFGLGGQF